MKKTFLFILPLLFMAFSTNAQTNTVWDFSITTTWPISAGESTNVIKNNLGLFAGASVANIGQVEANQVTFSADGYNATQRFKLNGASYDTTATVFTTPTKRYIYFAVNGPVTIKVWFKTGGSGTRNIYVTDGSNIVGSLGSTSSTDQLILTANYTGAAGNIYIAGDQSSNLYKVQVTGTGTNGVGTTQLMPVLATSEVPTKNVGTQVFSSGTQVNIANVTKNAQVKVYTMNGTLVKSFKINSSEAKFEMNKGIYIVNVKTDKEEIAQKVSLR